MNTKTKSHINIKFLKYEQNSIPILADIWHDVLGKIWLPDTSKADIINDLQSSININHLPITFVALLDNHPVGMCTLSENDGILPDLTPWFGDLVVNPKYQNKGIGSMLVQAAIEKARQMNFKKLYLFAFDKTIPNYYKKLGWQTIGTDNFAGHDVTVMNTTL